MLIIRLLLSDNGTRLRLPLWSSDISTTAATLAPEAASASLRRILNDRTSREHLRLLAKEWTPAHQLRAWDDQELHRKYLDWISRGEVRIVAQAPESGRSTTFSASGPVGKPAEASPPPPPKKKKKSWIALELVDQDGEPVANEKFKVELPDGSVQTGNLDSQGKFRIEEIDPPGTCKVSFPELDAADWKAS